MSREIPDAYPQDANATVVVAGVADAGRAARALIYLKAHNWSNLGSLLVPTPNASISPFYAPLSSGFEVEARLKSAAPSSAIDALRLVRTFWGYMLSQDPGSTWWEHILPDGTPSLGQFSSLAHGWGAGPTISLTTQVLGISPLRAGFAQYAIIPHPGDLKWAQGKVPTPYGEIRANWVNNGQGFTLETQAPPDTEGTSGVPTFGQPTTVYLDGRRIWNGSASSRGVSFDGVNVIVSGVQPGRHVLLARRN